MSLQFLCALVGNNRLHTDMILRKITLGSSRRWRFTPSGSYSLLRFPLSTLLGILVEIADLCKLYVRSQLNKEHQYFNWRTRIRKTINAVAQRSLTGGMSAIPKYCSAICLKHAHLNAGVSSTMRLLGLIYTGDSQYSSPPRVCCG